MRKKTALRTPQRETSLRKQGGLIVRGKNSQESATAKSTLTNRSHRTSIRLQVVPANIARPRSVVTVFMLAVGRMGCKPRSLRRPQAKTQKAVSPSPQYFA